VGVSVPERHRMPARLILMAAFQFVHADRGGASKAHSFHTRSPIFDRRATRAYSYS